MGVRGATAAETSPVVWKTDPPKKRGGEGWRRNKGKKGRKVMEDENKRRKKDGERWVEQITKKHKLTTSN